MTKRPIDAFRPRGLSLGERIYSDQDIDDIIAKSEELPEGDVQDLRPDDDGQELCCVMVPRREALHGRLESVAKRWRVEAEFQQRPTPLQLKLRFASIEATAGQLLVDLGVSEDGDLDSMPPAAREGLQAQAAVDVERQHFSTLKSLKHGQARLSQSLDALDAYPEATGAELLHSAIQGAYQIQDWARRAGDTERAKGGVPRAERHGRDEAFDRLLGGLIGIWVDVFERSPGMSVGAPERGNEGLAYGPMLDFIDACLVPLLGQEKPSRDAIRSRIRHMSISTRNKC